MTNRKDINIGGNPLNSITGIILMVLFLLGLFYLARFIFNLLYWLAPVMLVATLIIDYKVVTGYIQWLISMVKRNTLVGVGAIILTIFGFPVVSAFLLGKALFKKKVKEAKSNFETRRREEFVEFEELESERLDLPEIEPQKKSKNSEYDQLFDE